jgi:redox-sensing transcriptional repressor
MKRADKKKKAISVPTIRRLPMYLSFLKSTRNQALTNITASEIAKELHLDPTQISKDFSAIDVKGKTRIGYKKDTLISVIEMYLGYHILRKAFIVGVGNLGEALIKYQEFKQEGMSIVAGFDIDEDKIGQEVSGVKIYNMKEFNRHFRKMSVDIGILAVPGDRAQEVANIMIACGIKAIWNFSASPISAPDDIIIQNTSIDSGLAMIKWKLNRNIPLIYKNRIL